MVINVYLIEDLTDKIKGIANFFERKKDSIIEEMITENIEEINIFWIHPIDGDLLEPERINDLDSFETEQYEYTKANEEIWLNTIKKINDDNHINILIVDLALNKIENENYMDKKRNDRPSDFKANLASKAIHAFLCGEKSKGRSVIVETNIDGCPLIWKNMLEKPVDFNKITCVHGSIFSAGNLGFQEFIKAFKLALKMTRRDQL